MMETSFFWDDGSSGQGFFWGDRMFWTGLLLGRQHSGTGPGDGRTALNALNVTGVCSFSQLFGL